MEPGQLSQGLPVLLDQQGADIFSETYVGPRKGPMSEFG